MVHPSNNTAVVLLQGSTASNRLNTDSNLPMEHSNSSNMANHLRVSMERLLRISTVGRPLNRVVIILSREEVIPVSRVGMEVLPHATRKHDPKLGAECVLEG